MIELLTDPQAWISLLTLSVLEVVLGIDNIIFISILSGKLAPVDQPKARRFGLMGAFLSRVALLLSITWVMRLTEPLFALLGRAVSGRDLILLVGGLGLLLLLRSFLVLLPVDLHVVLFGPPFIVLGKLEVLVKDLVLLLLLL